MPKSSNMRSRSGSLARRKAFLRRTASNIEYLMSVFRLPADEAWGEISSLAQKQMTRLHQALPEGAMQAEGFVWYRLKDAAPLLGTTMASLRYKISKTTIPVPSRLFYIASTKKRLKHYRADYLVYLAGREGLNCVNCLKPLKPAQNRFCSRACALSHEHRVSGGEDVIEVPISMSQLYDLFRAQSLRSIDLASEIRLILDVGLSHELAQLQSYQQERGMLDDRGRKVKRLADLTDEEEKLLWQEEPDDEWLKQIDEREADELGA